MVSKERIDEIRKLRSGIDATGYDCSERLKASHFKELFEYINQLEQNIDRAQRLRDQVMKTWNPPVSTGKETKVTIAQTAVMQTLAFVIGREFMPETLTDAQNAAIDGGMELMIKTIGA